MSPRADLTSAKVAHQTTETKPLRRDAELNLARILVAARDVFAEHGYEASMEQIASRAEVGIGTLYRRFPNKADLCAAVTDAATERTRQIAEKVLLEVAPDEAVFEFVRRCVDAPSSWRAATVRPDVVPTDLVVTLMSVRALGDLCDADAPDASLRFLELALDGLGPGHKAPANPPMSVKQLGRVLTDR